MIVRSAYLEGAIKPEARESFARRMREIVLPAIATYPGIRAVKLREAVEADPGAPTIAMVFDLYFDSLDDMRAALASPVRQTVRAKIAEVMGGFDGRVYHLVTREGP